MSQEPLNPMQNLLPGYALNALGAEERERMEQALAADPVLRRQLADYLAATAALADGVPQVVPDEALRARVLAWFAPTPLTASARRRFPRLAWGLAAAVMVLAGAFSGVAALQQARINDLRTDIAHAETSLAQQRTLSYWALTPGVSAVSMRPVATPQMQVRRPAEPRAMLVVNPERTVAVLMLLDLPVLGADGVYQVWLVETDGTVHSGGVVTIDASGYGQAYIHFPEQMGQVAAVSVSVEPTGGSRLPSQRVVMRGNVVAP